MNCEFRYEYVGIYYSNKIGKCSFEKPSRRKEIDPLLVRVEAEGRRFRLQRVMVAWQKIVSVSMRYA